jgi:hypothetical protein
MATPRRDRIAELEEKYAQALATINQLTVNNAAMSAQLGQGFGRTYASGGQLAVGIRNISNYTISLEDSTTGQLVLHDLHPEIPGRPDPKTRAVISYAYWQQLRTSRQYRLGLIVRDDSVLGPAENVAPPDREEDLPTEALINQVLEPKTYIESKSEEELRDAIEQMTSGPSIRRLIEAVDAEVQRLADTKFANDPERPKKAIRALQAKYKVVEEMCYDRLDELNPMSGSKEETEDPRLGRRYARS